jgi:hypothetical protein
VRAPTLPAVAFLKVIVGNIVNRNHRYLLDEVPRLLCLSAADSIQAFDILVELSQLLVSWIWQSQTKS